eukprot:858377-Rhodomonas_salina.3
MLRQYRAAIAPYAASVPDSDSTIRCHLASEPGTNGAQISSGHRVGSSGDAGNSVASVSTDTAKAVAEM